MNNSTRRLSLCFLVLSLLGGACAQQLPCAPSSTALSGGECAARKSAFLIAAAQTQKDNPQSAEHAPESRQMPGMQMEMHSPKDVASDVSAVQEPEDPHQQTGADSPVIDLLADARKLAPRRLEEFEQLAAAANPTIKQAQASVRAVAGRASQAGLLPNPTIGYEGAEIRGGSFGGGEHGGYIQQTFVLGGKLGLRREALDQQSKAGELGVDEQRLIVLGMVRAQFYRALAAQQSAEVRARILTLMLDAAATAHQLANVGQADAPDVLQTEIEAEQAKLDLDSAQRDFIQSFRTLATLAGHPEMQLAMLTGDLEHPPQIDAEQVLQSVLTNNPSMKRAQQEMLAAQAAVKRDRRELVPDLTVRVGGQQSFEQTASGRAAGYESFASASIDLPLFNRNQGVLQTSSAELERARSEVQRTRLVLLLQAQPLVERYTANKLRAERFRTQLLPRAQRAYELYQQKYRNMAAAYPEVIISRRTFFQLQEDYVRTLGELWIGSQQLQDLVLTNSK